MFLTDLDADEVTSDRDGAPGSSMVAVVVGTAIKTLLAALAGFVLTGGLGLLVWSVTPSSGSGAMPLLRAGVAAFCSANGMTLHIGRSGLTVSPLMFTLVAVALLTTVSGRGRVIARGREQETAVVTSAAIVYAIVVTGVGAALGAGTVSAGQWWRPAMLAFVVVGVVTLLRADGWWNFLLDRLPVWVPVSIRCGGAAMATLLGGGAITLVIGLVRTFGDASTVQTLAAPGAAGGLGMALLGIAYLPNAVVAATGYSTGVGFTIGSGTYTPFGSTPVELPAVSLLTAVPDSHAIARSSLLLLAFPVLAALVIGWGVVRRLDSREDRLFATGGAALVTGLLSAVIAGVAGGGVTGGAWSSSGVPPVLFGSVVAVLLAAVGAGVVLLSKVPAREFLAVGDRSDATADEADDEGADKEDAEDVDAAEAAEVADAEAGEEEAGEDEAGEDEAGEDEAGEDEAGEDAGDEVAAAEVAAIEDDGAETSIPDEAASDDAAVDDQTADGADQAAEVKAESAGPVDDQELVEVDENGDVPASSDEAVDEQVPTEVDVDPSVTPAIPTPREEDVVADELAAGQDPDVTLVSGLSRRPGPRRTG